MSDFRAYRRRLLLVQVDGDITIRGRVNHETKRGVYLTGAELLEDDGATPMDGEVFVPRERIVFVQAMPGGEV